MGQRNQLEQMLAAIRRKKQLYIRNLDLVHSIKDREELKENIRLLSMEEQRILEQLHYDALF